MFGVGARAEILRSFLAQGADARSVVALASAAGYTKRNVAEECETLQRAGVLSVRAQGNRFYYSLARSAELRAFVGSFPGILPDWTAMLNVARALVFLERRSLGTELATLPVHASRTLRTIRDDLDKLGVEAPSENLHGVDLWPALRQLGDVHLDAWSLGQWPSATAAQSRIAEPPGPVASRVADRGGTDTGPIRGASH